MTMLFIAEKVLDNNNRNNSRHLSSSFWMICFDRNEIWLFIIASLWLL